VSTFPLVLVRHGKPERLHGVDPREWPLASDAMDAIVALGDVLGIDDRVVVASSDERKAIATAEVLRGARDVTVARGFREVTKPWFDDPEDLARATHRYLSGEPLDGWEPQAAALERFGAGLEQPAHAERLVVVTHGTVMTAWMASVMAIGPAGPFWSQLRMPDAYAIDVSAGRFERIPLDG